MGYGVPKTDVALSALRGAQRLRLDAALLPVTELALSADERLLAAAGGKGCVAVWDVQQLLKQQAGAAAAAPVHTWRCETGYFPTSLVWHPSRNQLLVLLDSNSSGAPGGLGDGEPSPPLYDPSAANPTKQAVLRFAGAPFALETPIAFGEVGYVGAAAWSGGDGVALGLRGGRAARAPRIQTVSEPWPPPPAATTSRAACLCCDVYAPPSRGGKGCPVLPGLGPERRAVNSRKGPGPYERHA